MDPRTRVCCGAVILVSLGFSGSAHALWWGTYGSWDTQTRKDAADAAMLAVVNRFNVYGDFNWGNDGWVDVYYNSGVPTAQAGYYSSIDFGGTWPNERVTQHEINHWLGSGTYWNWSNMWDSNGLWTGAKMNALIQQFDGDGAVIHQSGVHFYSYGLNYDNEVVNDSILMRNVALMYAMRQDMGNGNPNDPWSAKTVTLTASDPIGTSAFNWFGGSYSGTYQGWSDKYFAHAGAAYYTGDYTIRTPLDTYSPTSATPSFTFAGDSLTINNTNGINGGLLFKGLGTSSVITIRNLILDGGYVRHASTDTALFQLAGNVTLKGSSTIDAAQGNIKILSNIGGNGDLNIKSSGFTVTLAGTNNYTGTTNVNSGTLAFSAAPSSIGGIVVADGAALRVQALGGATTTVTSSSLTLGMAGSTSLALDLGAMNRTTPLIATGAFTVNGTVSVTLQNISTLDPGVHPLIGYNSFSGSGTFSGSPFTIDPRTTGTLVNNGTNALVLNITGDRPVWSGGDNGAWAVGTTGAKGNWKLRSAGTATDYIQGDNVLFDDSATGSTAININSANVSPARITFDNSSKNYSISGAYGLAGTTVLIKNGSGTLTIATANSYSGGTTINAGAISISSNSNLGTSSAPVTLNGGTLVTTAGITNTHPITVGSSGGTISVTTSGQYYLNTTNALLGSGPLALTGTGKLTANMGNLRVDHTNSYSGPMTARQGGIFEYGVNGAVDSTAAMSIGDEGEIAVQGGSWAATTLPNPITVSGNSTAAHVLSFENGTAGTVSGPITLNADLTIGLRDWYNYAAVRGGTVSGVISGTGGLKVQSGTGSGGTLTLSGANTFTGNITLDHATLAAGSYNAGNTAASNPSNLGDLAASGRTITLNSGGVLSLTSGNVLGTGGSQNTLSGLTLVVNPDGVFQSGLQTTGSGWWNKIGNLQLNGGSVHVGSGANSSNFQALALIGTVSAGGTAPSTIDTFAGSDTTSNGIHLGQNGTAGQVVTFNVADATGDAAVDLSVSARLLNTSNSLAASGLRKTGSGTMLLSANSSYTGPTTIGGGTLRVTGSIASSSGVTINSGGTLDGTGTVPAISLNAGGHLAPGADGIGTLSGSSLTWSSDGTSSGGLFELGTGSTSDLLALNGALTTGSGSQFLFDFTGGVVGQSYTLISYTSTTFTQSANSSEFGLGAASLAKGYSGVFSVDGNSIDFKVTAVPEPTSLGAIGLGAAALLQRRRRTAAL